MAIAHKLSEMSDSAADSARAVTASPPVRAARNTLRVLRYLSNRSGPVRASTLARDLGLPRSSAYQLLAAMMDEGFLVHYRDVQAYGLSSLLSEIGTSSVRTERLGRLGVPLLERLVAATSVPVVAHLAVLSGPDVMYVARIQGFRAPTTVSRIGVRLPAHLTATGRSLLAGLSANQVTALYPHDRDLIVRAGAGPRTRSQLDGILARARSDGWADEDGEISPDYASVGAAALDSNGYPVAAVGLTFRTVAADANTRAELGRAVSTTAAALSARLAGRA
jgi:DNA-binding IclR family transcriptional regulator